MDIKTQDKMKKFLSMLVVVTILTSCDPPPTIYRKIIVNNTNYELSVVKYGSNKVVTNSYVLKPNTQSVIQNRSMMDRLTEGNCILKTGDSLAVFVNNNAALKVATDLNKESSWMGKSSGNSAKGYTLECKATTTNSDIAPK